MKAQGRDKNIEKVKLFLEHNADVNSCMNDGTTPLIVAAEIGDVDFFVRLLKDGADVNKAMDNGATPLILAVQNDHVEVVKLLLEHEADVNKAMDNGATPLIIASRDGKEELVKLLINNGADVDKCMGNSTDQNDSSALSKLSALLAAGPNSLILAAQNGHTGIVKLLLSKIKDVNKAMNDGTTPLMKAAQNGHIEIVELLIAKGADVNKGTDGGSSLTLAISYGHTNVVKALLKTHNIHLSYMQGTNNFILQFAKEKGFDDIINVLDLYRCFRAIVDGYANTISIVGYFSKNENINYIGDLFNSYFYYKGIKLFPESIEKFISQYNIDVPSYNMSDQQKRCVKEYDLMLKNLKDSLLKDYKEFKDDLFTLEGHLVAIYDPEFYTIIMQNSNDDPGNIGNNFFKTQPDNSYLGEKSFLGLIGRRPSATNPDKYEGEVLGQGIILQKFIHKIKTNAKQEIDLIEPLLVNANSFSDFCKVFKNIQNYLPRNSINKVNFLIKEITDQQDQPTFKLMSKLVDKNDSIIAKLNEVEAAQELSEQKIHMIERENHILQNQYTKVQNRDKILISIFSNFVKGYKTGSINWEALEDGLSELICMDIEKVSNNATTDFPLSSENDALHGSFVTGKASNMDNSH
ncbi:MAG: Pfs, and Ankyrin domain protein [Rickettsiaceae bacterium]|jgi:ankyrin repeat protein|nr:Pfs, and Ankyrin domain protein [Rickettsiaceae bacterium]